MIRCILIHGSGSLFHALRYSWRAKSETRNKERLNPLNFLSSFLCTHPRYLRAWNRQPRSVVSNTRYLQSELFGEFSQNISLSNFLEVRPDSHSVLFMSRTKFEPGPTQIVTKVRPLIQTSNLTVSRPTAIPHSVQGN